MIMQKALHKRVFSNDYIKYSSMLRVAGKHRPFKIMFMSNNRMKHFLQKESSKSQNGEDCINFMQQKVDLLVANLSFNCIPVFCTPNSMTI